MQIYFIVLTQPLCILGRMQSIAIETFKCLNGITPEYIRITCYSLRQVLNCCLVPLNQCFKTLTRLCWRNISLDLLYNRIIDSYETWSHMFSLDFVAINLSYQVFGDNHQQTYIHLPWGYKLLIGEYNTFY